MDDASLRRLLVDQEIRSAEDKAGAARAEVERISNEHLDALMRLSRSERADRIDDPELVRSDRKTMVDSLIITDLASDGFWPSATGGWNMVRWRRLWGLNRHRVPAFAKVGIPLVLVGICLATVYRNTGQLVPAGDHADLTYTLPSGLPFNESYRAGDQLVVIGRWGRFYVRRWEPREAYALAPIAQ